MPDHLPASTAAAPCPPPSRFGHSALVRMSLSIGTQTLLVSQIGPDFIILKGPSASPPTAAAVTLEVDGVSEDIPIYLPHGLSPDSRRVEVIEAGMAPN